MDEKTARHAIWIAGFVILSIVILLVGQSMYSDYLIHKATSNGKTPIEAKCAFGSDRFSYSDLCKAIAK
jgi:hypothetical protein